MQQKWWQEVVVYQIYPRSFQDSNNDGIGDLRGIIERLDYLAELGIGAIWLSPVYASPNDDNGYGISNYQAIMAEFGTMADMDELIQQAEQRGIKLIMDLVVNHTSDEHNWFIESRRNKENPYRDYYVWRDPKNGGEPNELRSIFGGSAWQFDEASGQYYLHLFSQKQPDLNWENPKVHQEIWQMMNFWLEKGIGGFRMDVIDLIGKLPDQMQTANGPKLHDYLQEMNQATFGRYDVLTVGETWGATPEEAKKYSDPKRNELSMVFQFEHIGLDEISGKEKWDLQPLDFLRLKEVFTKWQTSLGDEGWVSLFWNNHDLPRIVSRWGNDSQEFREVSAKMLATILHMQKGTPYIYQGEEIGMINTPVNSVDELDDIESINMYQERKAKGYSEAEIFRSINAKGRDNARRPMQWDDSEYAGFSDHELWLALNPDYQTINVAQNLETEDSIFHYYQKLIRLRKENEVMVWGDYQELLPDDPQLYVFKRMTEERQWLIIANFYEKETVYTDVVHQVKRVVIRNYCEADQMIDLTNLPLRPYEVLVVEVES